MAKPSVTFQLVGIREMERRMVKLAKRFRDDVPPALRMEAELIMTDSKRNFVPVKDGPLRASGTVHPATRMRDTVEVLLSFGGIATPYALEQHENLDFSHRVGEAKYLEKPLNNAVPGLDRRLAARLRLQGLV